MRLNRLFATLAGGTATLAGLLYYAARHEPDHIETVPLDLMLPRLDPAFDGYRIVQISDIHMGRWMTRERLESVVDQVNAQNADLIVITGDFVTKRVEAYHTDLVEPLSRLHSVDGVIGIHGNHDFYTTQTAHNVAEVMQESGIIDVNNAVHTLRRGDAALHIAGVDDVVARQARLDLTLAQLPDDDSCAILLAHEPDFIDIAAATNRFDLQLSGHTHGGQVRIPYLRAMVLPRHGRYYIEGLHRIYGMWLYVNRGIGMVTLPLRFNCPPEITVLTLRAP